MKTDLQKVSNLGRKINIEVPAALVQSTFDKMFKGIQRDAHIKGFRKGKAPISTIKSVYGDRVKQDVMQELMQMGWQKAIEEHKVEPMSYPSFEFDDLHEEKNFSFSADFEVRPEVVVKKFEGLEVLKEKYEFDPSRVEKVFDNIRSSRATFEPVLENRPAQNGDVSVIDFEGFVNSAPLENGKGEDHHLELGSGQFIGGFEDGIIGMTAGQEKTISLKFPDAYHVKDLAGKPVDFKVKLKQLKKRALPELTDEFIQSLGGPQKTLAELREVITKDMEETEIKRINDDLKNRLLKALVKENPVDVPQGLLKDQKEALIKDFEKRMADQGLSEVEFEEYKSKWDKDFEATASQMIQSGFLVDAIAQGQNLQWSKEDLDKKFEEYVKQIGIEMARIREFYQRPESMNRLTYQITEEKVIEFLLSKSKITEVSKDQIKED